MIALWLSLIACSATLKRVLPEGPVLSAEDAEAWNGVTLPEVAYTGPPRFDGLLPPVQLFGIYYGVDVVIVSDHPDWDMHEYARLDTPQGPVWMAKDSSTDLVQTISTDLDEVDSWAADVPVPRQQTPIRVTEAWDGRKLDFSMAYTNPAGDPVEVHVEGVLPKRPPGLRNGNTMGHSRQAVAAVLDLERFGHRAKADITIGGQPYNVERLLGVYAMRFLLQQAQAGFAITDLTARPSADGVTIVRPGSAGVDWPTRATEPWTTATEDGLALLRYDDGYLVRTYAFASGGLAWGEVVQHGRGLPVLRAHFSPALPDVTRPFEGEAVSRFRLDVNGQVGHGVGTVRVRWVDDEALVVEIEPEAPRWLQSRPMVGTIRHNADGTAGLTIHTLSD